MKRDAKQVFTELLVYKAQDGDEKAFADLYELWKLDLIRLGRSVLRDREGMKDAAQDAWIAIARGIRKLDDPARFRAWAFSILRGKCIDRIRRESRERARDESYFRASQMETTDTVSGPKIEAAADLAEAISKLDTDARILLHLYYEAELSVSEISEAMEIPEGTVKSRLHAVRRQLKKQLEGLQK
ncbi:RNA polymerase sigma factor [Pelagicoccus sp. SDUM812003]|uniref:RNA polymerase sigma factor n=1 Tax=Pelagicoccus sp. SDUM812003 TaxID=3041267 RepID=UPI0028101484|nr:RNA polymerase sigma factor [Pelagicoccus sp. SDUM812003]MDQ8203736.1 RNA polymerase sigma factor [Pelagicoccus sp. SDUM812003]